MNQETEYAASKALFFELLSLPESDRQQYLLSHSSTETVKQQAAKLLTAHHDHEFLRPVELPPIATNPKNTEACLLGMRVGNFELRECIGVGSMGVVYEALQENPQRHVAVKILRLSGLISPANVGRFLHEAEILAQFQHPGIVQIYASGMLETELGQVPWYAMERLEGQSLDLWCQQQTRDSKLRALIQLLDAVQHAHERGVIHRDLKPANVLVCDHQPSASAESLRLKVLDFGVARLVSLADSPELSQTCTGDVVGTIQYMSPEQLNGRSSEADARSDIYSAAVLGFEMLTGHPPYPVQDLTFGEQIELRRHDPPMLGSIDSKLAGDLEAVFARALEIAPDRRYASAFDFAQDLQRFLDKRPVVARKPSFVYRLGKYLHRNYVAALGVTATFLALAIGLAMYASEARRSSQAAARSAYEAEKASAINTFLTNDFMPSLIAGQATPAQTDVQALIDDACATLDAMFGDRPRILAAVRNEAGTLYYNVHCLDKAAAQYEIAGNLWASELGSRHPDTLKARSNYGLALMQMQRYEVAENVLLETLLRREEVLGEAHPDSCTTRNNLAMLYKATEQLDQAESLLRKTVAISQAGQDLRAQITFRSNLANILNKQGKEDEALEISRMDYKECQRVYGHDHGFTLGVGFEFSKALYRQGRYSAAAQQLSEILRLQADQFGYADKGTLLSVRLLARSLNRGQEHKLARAVIREAMAALEQLPESDEQQRTLERELERINDH